MGCVWMPSPRWLFARTRLATLVKDNKNLNFETRAHLMILDGVCHYVKHVITKLIFDDDIVKKIIKICQ